jgi:hypothetical protein
MKRSGTARAAADGSWAAFQWSMWAALLIFFPLGAIGDWIEVEALYLTGLIGFVAAGLIGIAMWVRSAGLW